MITATAADTLDAVPASASDALSSAWLAIRKQVPDVPAATVKAGPGLAHVTDWDDPVVMVPPGTVAEGGVKIMEFLLHQAAHSLDGIAYAGAAGRYHGEGYRAAAERLGLAAERAPGLGWAKTSLASEAAGVYSGQITSLDSASRDFDAPAPRQTSRRITVVCACPRKMSVVPSVFYEGPVRCEVCGEVFREAEHSATRE